MSLILYFREIIGRSPLCHGKLGCNRNPPHPSCTVFLQSNLHMRCCTCLLEESYVRCLHCERSLVRDWELEGMLHLKERKERQKRTARGGKRRSSKRWRRRRKRRNKSQVAIVDNTEFHSSILSSLSFKYFISLASSPPRPLL